MCLEKEEEVKYAQSTFFSGLPCSNSLCNAVYCWYHSAFDALVKWPRRMNVMGIEHENTVKPDRLLLPFLISRIVSLYTECFSLHLLCLPSFPRCPLDLMYSSFCQLMSLMARSNTQRGQNLRISGYSRVCVKKTEKKIKKILTAGVLTMVEDKK